MRVELVKFDRFIEICGGNKKLADMISISEQTVSNIKRSRQIPTFQVVMKFNEIAEELSLKIDYLDMLKNHKIKQNKRAAKNV